MEKIKVNMSPNPLDVQTIHASQNDTEARQWEFELHNNGELIDTSDVKEQLVFKAYKGGTEQLLPENTSTPTTSPFLGDIKYPQGLLTDQEFTYRQSPTESDGLAKITDIKGNTLVWNQLVNYTRATQTVNGITFTNNGDGSCSFAGTATAMALYQLTDAKLPITQGHKYLFKGANGGNSNCRLDIRTSSDSVLNESVNIGTDIIFTASQTDNCKCMIRVANGTTISTAIKFTPQLFDLTQMFGAGNEPSIQGFKELFPNDYYEYNVGQYMNIGQPVSLETIGKNLLNLRATQTVSGITFTNDNGIITINGTATANAYFTTEIGLRRGSYFIGAFNDEISSNVHIAVQAKSGAYPLDAVMSIKNRVASLNNDVNRFLVYVNSGATLNNFVMKPMISFESPEYFEPYTSSTLSLPISTYFPTGMKSAGTVYDELTPRKAITRIGAVDLGSLNWTYYSQRSNFYAIISDMAVPSPNSRANAKYLLGNPVTWHEMLENNNDNNTFAITEVSGEKRFYIKNTTYTDVTAFKTAMSGVYLYYELATPTETSFTTASLVTENAEIPLSNEDDTLIGKCTEQLSENPGFFDAKIKLSDSDGECYSNKLQLHVERKPS